MAKYTFDCIPLTDQLLLCGRSQNDWIPRIKPLLKQTFSQTKKEVNKGFWIGTRTSHLLFFSLRPWTSNKILFYQGYRECPLLNQIVNTYVLNICISRLTILWQPFGHRDQITSMDPSFSWVQDEYWVREWTSRALTPLTGGRMCSSYIMLFHSRWLVSEEVMNDLSSILWFLSNLNRSLFGP